jgi:hypothetical protein
MRFLHGSELNSEIEKIFSSAEKEIIIISPYIKLHHRIKSILELKKESPKIKIVVVYGKNENDKGQSMDNDQVSFLTDFPNIEIRHEKNLHAKFYANENQCILTSMNLFDYSQNNNIEAGMLFEKNSMLGNVVNNIINDVNKPEYEMIKYFDRVVVQAHLLYQTEPNFERVLLINRYVDFKINVDKIGVPDQQKKGYCIRTGVEIPFNPKMPFCEKSFKSWSKYGDENYPEKFCHYSGESSSGETTFSHPILKKNWKKSTLPQG